MTRKVIFVGGTSFSGSTFFQLTLANDPAGFACGEVHHLFRPTKERHLQRGCGCGDPDCQVWPNIKVNGEEHLYESIFEQHPGVEFILDASKNVGWIREQSERLTRQGIEAYQLVIWKTPLEFAQSLRKRDRIDDLRHWPRYHKLFYTEFDDWRAVQYAQYVQEQASVLQATCAYLGIPYFDGKERFWEKTHHVLGGNLSSRIHLYDKGDEQFSDVQSRAVHGLSAAEKHRSVYYEKPTDPALQALVDELVAEFPETNQVEAMLQAYDVFNKTITQRDWPSLQMSWPALQLKRLRSATRAQLSKLRA